MKKVLAVMCIALAFTGCGNNEKKEVSMIELSNRYSLVENFNNSYARVYKNKKYGYINSKGEEIAPCIYDNIGSTGFVEDMLLVQKDKLWGFVNTKGEEIIPCVYSEAYAFNEGVAIVSQNDMYGLIDKKGNEVIPCIYDSISNVNNGVATARINAEWYIIEVK